MTVTGSFWEWTVLAITFGVAFGLGRAVFDDLMEFRRDQLRKRRMAREFAAWNKQVYGVGADAPRQDWLERLHEEGE